MACFCYELMSISVHWTSPLPEDSAALNASVGRVVGVLEEVALQQLLGREPLRTLIARERLRVDGVVVGVVTLQVLLARKRQLAFATRENLTNKALRNPKYIPADSGRIYLSLIEFPTKRSCPRNLRFFGLRLAL